MDIKTQLINEIMSTLGIEAAPFTVSMIEDSIDGIEPSQYKPFFKALMSEDHRYLKPLDRVSKVSKEFITMRCDNLFADTRHMAEGIYSRLYDLNTALSTYAADHRSTIADDRIFFESIDYDTLKAEQLTPTKQDAFVIRSLGGGAWLFGIKRAENAGKVIDAIESIIKTAITEKYLKKPGMLRLTS